MRAIRGVVRAALIAVLMLLAGGAAGHLPMPAVAQEPGGLPWERLTLTNPVFRLFTPPSGVIFAQTKDGLLRSEDRAATWESIPLPEINGRRFMQVHPIDPQIVYSTSNVGIEKTTDSGATWTVTFGPFNQAPDFLALAHSFADPDLLYATVGGGVYQFIRTSDAGATWETLERSSYSLCKLSTPVLSPHPTDPDKLALSNLCAAGRETNGTLSLRGERGASRLAAFSTDTGSGQTPRAWSWGTTDGRRLIALGDTGGVVNNRYSRVEVQRSDDDGVTWTRIMHLTSNSSGEGGDESVRPIRFSISSLIQDSGNPGAAYVVVKQFPPGSQTATSRILRYSFKNLGAWSELGIPSLGTVESISLTGDGQYLYAATENGLWRLPQPGSQPFR